MNDFKGLNSETFLYMLDLNCIPIYKTLRVGSIGNLGSRFKNQLQY